MQLLLEHKHAVADAFSFSKSLSDLIRFVAPYRRRRELRHMACLASICIQSTAPNIQEAKSTQGQLQYDVIG